MKKINLLLLICLIIFSCDKDVEEEIDSIPPVLSFEIEGVKKPETSDEIPIVGNKMEININAEDEKGISKVEAYINNTKLAEDKTAPFKLSIDLNSYNSTKKNTANKGEVFILKIVAQDNSGNKAVSEQEIYIDNTLPTISKVSLEEGAILNGIENTISFIAEDDQDITKLEVFLNNEIIEFETLEDNNYSLSFDSTKFEDGEKTLKIVAEDAAENNTIYEVKFITDNTGPEIIFEDIKEEDIITESTVIKPSLKDLYSEIDSVKIKLNDSIILNSTATEISFELNPDDYSTGENQISITAKDKLGNTTVSKTNFIIYRKLITINIPNNFIDPQISSFFVFASDQNGKILAIEPIEYNTNILTLSTPQNISIDQNYMLTFSYRYKGVAETSILKTIQNVNKSNLKEINLKIPERISIVENNTYSSSEIPQGTIINTEGSHHRSNYDQASASLYIEDYQVNGISSSPKKYYVSYHNTTNNTYKYQIIEKPIPNNFILEYNNFIEDDIETNYYNSSSIVDPNEFNYLELNGYMSESEFEKNIFHRIWNYGYQNDYGMNTGKGYSYSFYPHFYKYSYVATLQDYTVEAIGKPLEYFDKPDWSIDYNYEKISKTISIISTGNEHNIGKVSMGHTSPTSNYTWTVLFDSQSSQEIIIPEIPEELNQWNINNYYASDDLTIEQIEIKKYQNINTYNEFLNSVIRNNEYNFKKVTTKTESVFKTNVGAYIKRPDFSFYY